MRMDRYNNPPLKTKKETKERKQMTKSKALLASLVVLVMIGGAMTLAYLTDTTDALVNVFQKGKKYTLTYHANTGSATEDAKVTDLPEQDVKYGDGNTAIEFTVSSDQPIRPGMLFKGWFKKENPTGDDILFGKDGEETYTAPQDQYESHLYAQWSAGYKLIYDPNGGSGIPAITTVGAEKVSGSTVEVVTNDDEYVFSKIATQGDMKGPEEADGSSDHRVFLGWSTDKNAEEPDITSDGILAYANTAGDYDRTKVKGFDDSVTIKAAENSDKTVILYAVWATKYELSFAYHPDMISPKCGDPAKLQQPITLVSATNKAPTFNLKSQSDADAEGHTPTREEGYRWGWWGDNLERFKFNKPNEGQTAVQAGNEGCYQFGEPVPARTTGDDPAKAPNWDDPTLTLYAYFQPPAACSLVFDDNSRVPNGTNADGTIRYIQNPKYPELTYTDADGDNRNDNVKDMPDDAGASTTEIVWKKDIPSGDENTPKHAKWYFLGWSEDRNATEPQFQPGDTVNLNKVIKNKLTLYAIWKPMHTYRIHFNRGYKNDKGTLVYNGTNEYYVQTSSGQWKSGPYNIWFDSDATKYETAASKYITDTSYTWPAGFFNKKGYFATKDDDSVGTYKFLGWSWEAQTPSTDEEALMSKVAFPVTLPDDPAGILNTIPDGTDTTGTITDAITVEEGTPCTKPTRHEYTLYAVYRKSPLHQLRVVFDKGSAGELEYKGEQDGSSDVHCITIDGVVQRKNKYYASLDHPTYTWDTTYWQTKTPSASKEAEKDGTATYTFLGWTTDESQKTPSPTITKDDIDYPVDENGRITKSITVSEKAAQAKDCEGGIHSVTLYPVFKKNLFHVYKLNYDVNAPSTADGIVTKLYDNFGGSWKSVQVFPDPASMDPKPDPLPEKGDATGNLYTETRQLSDTHLEWDMSGKGYFATCDNTGKTPTGAMTFLGWSNRKFKLGEYDPADPPKKPGTEDEDDSIKFYPVTAPSDPSNPGDAGKFGQDVKIKIDVDEQDPKPSDACTDEKGNVHTETLYGVWAGEPIHQYSVIFAGNSNSQKQDDVKIVYGKKADWESGDQTKLSKSAATITKTYKKDNVDIPVKYYDQDEEREIALTDDLKNTYRVFSEALPLKGTTTDSYTFGSSFWNDDSDPKDVKDLIVKAERTATPDTKYIFKGWNTKPDGSGTSITVNEDGYITTDLTVKDTEYEHCDSYTHNIILYAQWEAVKIHNFQLIFSYIDANGLGYNDNGTWRSISTKYIYKNDIQNNLIDESQLEFITGNFNGLEKATSKLEAKGPGAKLSYSWGERGDSGEKLRVMASKNKTNKYEYEFVGWSKTKKLPSKTHTSGDVDYTVDASGYIQEEIEITDPDITTGDPGSECEHPTHTLVLYPVFKIVPIHNFSVTLDLNGGSGLRAYNASADKWSNSSTYTYYKPEGTNANTKKKVSETEGKYTWSYDDFWSGKGFGAYKNYDKFYTYELVGWSTEKKDISENPDTTTNMVGWTKNSIEYASGDSAQMTPLVNGFITQSIDVECSENPCDGGNHSVTIYAVWKRTPRAKTYKLNFDANGGENPPLSLTQIMTYDGTSSWNTGSFPLTNQMIVDAGMKNKRLAFVGWHENSKADQGKYGEKNTANNELEQLTQNLITPYVITNTAETTTLSSYTAERTLYAIWWFEYQLDYDANGGSGAPEHEHVYTSDRSYNYRISNDRPTHSAGYKFLGWSENKTEPGQGAESDVQYKASTGSSEVRYVVNVEGTPDDEDYGFTGKKLYAVWGPAN